MYQVRVQFSDEPEEWLWVTDGFLKPKTFKTKKEATEYAKIWTKKGKESCVRIEKVEEVNDEYND